MLLQLHIFRCIFSQKNKTKCRKSSYCEDQSEHYAPLVTPLNTLVLTVTSLRLWKCNNRLSSYLSPETFRVPLVIRHMCTPRSVAFPFYCYAPLYFVVYTVASIDFESSRASYIHSPSFRLLTTSAESLLAAAAFLGRNFFYNGRACG